MYTIKALDYARYSGRQYTAQVISDRYLSIEPAETGFEMRWVTSPEPIIKPISDTMLSDWLENPTDYGLFEGERLMGFAEGFLEKWNNRFRIANIAVFENADRRSGAGSALLQRMLETAAQTGARMAVLETQSFNYPAISFYKKHGFEIIGFDLYAYSNDGPAERNIRIEMGRRL